MRKRSLVVAALCCIFALTLGLVGCGGGGAKAADPVAQSKEAFTGTWDITGLVEDGKAMSKEDLDSIKSYGIEVYLDLNEDGSAVLKVVDEQATGTWTPKTAMEADLSFEGQTIALMLDGDTLSMENNGARLEFMKRDESASAGASSANASASTSTGSASASATAATGGVVTTSLTSDSNFKEKRELQTYVVADDDIARIETVAVFVDTDDDPGFIFWLTNKTDKELYFTNADGVFTVNGKQADPILSEDVAPGQTLETAMWFDHRELDSSKIDDFVNVKGQLEVWDGETLETLASYDFKF